MRYVPRRFGHLPTPLRMVLLLAGGGGLATLLYHVLPARLHWTLILLAGVVVVALVLMLFGALVQWGRKRKARPLEQGLAENVARTPQGVSKAAQRAQLDDLRRKFMEGIDTFRAAGKNLGEIPWYLIVGEPGSGKTEAIRHCRVGFPPGLHEELQGAGGTINMDWWFTDHAVILDTAGRLLFEDVGAGSTSEWQECLRLLATHRAGCPINGLILAIPADSLITDTAEQIEHKAGRLAAQLDVIQRTLGIRFPAFIVVTKCDLINGFREFFENLDDPDLQNQMVGWSNPADLDEPFDPSLVDQHLATVVERLKQRRYGLLLDPVPVGDASARRIDQVDALYAFPDSLQRVLPRLRQYLQMIFVGGQWSAKPLFLRGIYFTSAMREGSALDAELADALGVPVEQLPDGRVWQRERSYFLRDVFTEKAFREWGLVTRAERAKRQYTRRKAVVLGAGILAIALLALFTVYGWLTFRSALGERSEYFRAAAPLTPRRTARGADRPLWETDPRSGQTLFLPVVCHEARTTWVTFYYQDTEEIRVGGEAMTPAGFHAGLKAVNEEPIQVPAIFRVAAIGQDLAEDCRRAQRVLFERSVLLPVLLAVREQMADTPPENWGPSDAADPAVPSPPAETPAAPASEAPADAAAPASDPAPDTPAPASAAASAGGVARPAAMPTEALSHLMRLQAGDLSRADFDLGCLLRYIRPKGLDAALADLDDLQNVMDWLYRPDADAGAGQDWNPARLAGTEPPRFPDPQAPAEARQAREATDKRLLWQKAVENGAAGFIHYWSADRVRRQGNLSSLNRLTETLKTFSPYEEHLLNLRVDVPDAQVAPGGAYDAYAAALKEWDARYAALQPTRRKVDSCVAVLDGRTLPQAYEQQVSAALDDARWAYGLLLVEALTEASAPVPAGGGNPTADASERERAGLSLAASVSERSPAPPPASPGPEDVGADSPVVARLKQRLLAAWHDLNAELADRTKEPWPELGQWQTRHLVAVGEKDVPLYRHRYAIYEAAATAFDAAAEAPPDASDLQALRQYVADTSASAEAAGKAIQALRQQAPEAYRAKEAAGVAVERCLRLRAGVRCCDALRLAVQVLPATLPDLKQAVQDRAADADPVTLPTIPKTGLGKETSATYHPTAAGEVMGLRKEVGVCLGEVRPADTPADKPKPMTGVPDYERLIQAYRRTAAPYDEYQQEYVRYWMEELLGQLGQPGEAWDAWRQSLRKLPPAGGICLALVDLGKCIQDALDQAESWMPDDRRQALGLADWLEALAEQVRRAKQSARWPLYGEPVARWAALPAEPLDARNKILAMRPKADLIDTYLPMAEAPPPERFVDRYWAHLYHESFRLLAEAGRGLEDGLARDFTTRYARFPLNHPKEDGRGLTPEEVGQARAHLRRLGLETGQWPEGTVGAGETTGYAKIDERLDALRPGANLSPKLKTYLVRAGSLLAALPRDAPISVGVVMLGEKAAQPGHASEGDVAERLTQRLARTVQPLGGHWRYVRLYQQSDEPQPGPFDRLRDANAGSTDDVTLGAVRTPGPAVWFRLRRYASFEGAKPGDFGFPDDQHAETPWNLLEAVVRHGVFEDEAGNRRTIGLPVDDGKSVLGLRLEFEAAGPLPATRDWPEWSP